MNSFLHDVQTALIAEALQLLPRGTVFHDYQNGTFLFLQRRDSGKIILHKGSVQHWETSKRLGSLYLIRHGFCEAMFTQTEIVARDPNDNQIKWRPEFGLSGAPDGTYVTFTTPGNSTSPYRDFGDGRSITSYGIVKDGGYQRLLGTNWSGAHGWYSRWDSKPYPVLIKKSEVRVNPAVQQSYDLYIGADETGPDADLDALSLKINLCLEKDQNRYSFRGAKPPSPDYFDTSRWSYDPSDRSWTFK